MVELAMSAGWRRCRHCDVPFQPPDDLAEIAAEAVGLPRAKAGAWRQTLDSATMPELASLSAWVEGFCSRECLHAHALNVIATRSAWWLKRQSPKADAAVLRHIEERSLVMQGDDAPRPGELCKCGRPAITVYVTEKRSRVGYCGIPDGGEKPREGTA
jgi:hypothetical protein